MRLHELAFACRVYAGFTQYDRELARLREVTGPVVDLGDPSQAGPMLQLLRNWGCRQFAHRDDEISRQSALGWWAEWRDRLPDVDQTVDLLSDDEIATLAAAYEDLSARQASWQIYVDGRRVRKAFGPAGAAKTMFAIRPNACPPWDDDIRRFYGRGQTAADYEAHLRHIRSELAEALADADQEITAADLPRLVGRKLSSAAKLGDEYEWVVRTRGIVPPEAGDLDQWAKWAAGSTPGPACRQDPC